MQSNSFTIRLLKYLRKKKALFVYSPMFIYWFSVTVVNMIPADKLYKLQFYDKAEHIIAFFVLTVFLVFTCMVQEKFILLAKHPFITAFLLSSFYGFLNEIIQLYVPGRFCDFQDWLADVIGALAALLIMYPAFFGAVRILNKERVKVS